MSVSSTAPAGHGATSQGWNSLEQPAGTARSGEKPATESWSDWLDSAIASLSLPPHINDLPEYKHVDRWPPMG